MDLSGVVTGLANLLGSVTNPDRRQRRLWVSEGRAHIEVRGLHRFDADELRDKVATALEALEGVQWAQVNAITGRVAVVFDGEALSGEDLLGIVEGIEDAHESADERFPADRPELRATPSHCTAISPPWPPTWWDSGPASSANCWRPRPSPQSWPPW